MSALQGNFMYFVFYFKERSFFNFNYKFALPIMNNCNCKSSNCIYIIYCELCDVYYIGKTSLTLAARFKNQ